MAMNGAGVEWVPIWTVKADGGRPIVEANVKSLVKSIRTKGLDNPLQVNIRGELVEGFHRLEALKRLGWLTVPVRLATKTRQGADNLIKEAFETFGG